MKASTASPRAVLGIADQLCSPLASDSFITAFVLLGSALRRYLPSLDGRQLVVALSVPRRDYVAALIGAGWMMSAPAPKLDAPVDVFRAVEPGTYLRAVTEQEVITGVFTCLNEARTPPRVITGGTTRALSFYRAVAQLPHASENVEGDVPEPGFLGRLTGAAESWLERIAAPTTDLALIGTTKWLLDDLAALVGNSANDDAGSAPLANYVLPEVPKAATWATAVIPAARMRENNPIPSHCASVILDRPQSRKSGPKNVSSSRATIRRGPDCRGGLSSTASEWLCRASLIVFQLKSNRAMSWELQHSSQRH